MNYLFRYKPVCLRSKLCPELCVFSRRQRNGAVIVHHLAIYHRGAYYASIQVFSKLLEYIAESVKKKCVVSNLNSVLN